jgi:hypothetical protein
MSKSILDHLIETTARLRCATVPCEQTYGNGSQGHTVYLDFEAVETARRIVTEFAGPPCEEFEPGEAIGVCEICRWPSREQGRAK